MLWKKLLGGIAVGGAVGGTLMFVSQSIENIECQAKSVEVRAIREHSPNLFEAVVAVNALCRTEDEKKAFADLSRTLNQLLTLENYIDKLPKSVKWTAKTIEFKHKIRRILVYLEARHANEEFAQIKKTILDAAGDSGYNARTDNYVKLFDN
jgi:hypothetical protein